MTGRQTSRHTEKYPFATTLIAAVLFLASLTPAVSALEFPGLPPGRAQAKVSQTQLTLENNVISCTWNISGNRLKLETVTDKLDSTTLDMKTSECFELVLDGGQTIKASGMNIVGKPRLIDVKPNPGSYRMAYKSPGRQITAALISADKKLKVRWRAILRDGSNYIRQEVTLTTGSKAVDIKEIVLWELPASRAEVQGIVDGSPVTAGNIFFAYEYPLAKSQVSQADSSRVLCSLPYSQRLEPGVPAVHTSVVGVAAAGQLRRSFLYYIERQRVHPYRSFLHYNSWYDIGYRAEKIYERDFVQVVELFGSELINKRGVKMDSFVLDDGWDDPASLWRFHEGYPNGFTPLKKAVEKYDSVLGAWLSPFGGYGEAKEARLKYGRQQGFETNKSGFSLAGPKYFGRFRDVCIGMIRSYDLNYFKFDGIGTGGRPTGTTAEFAGDMQALLKLMGELRRVKPDVFINTTTGTWSSPYWLWYCDSTWRSGHDWNKYGAGTERQQQVTYRDKETYHNVVRRAPLYPLNSLMTQGVMFANHGLPNEPGGMVEDIRDFFASGTNCQELYITPSLMSEQAWDTLAEAAKWSRANSDVLVDTHWIGGDPAEGQIYGWASWSKRKGIISFRNPSDKSGAITIDIAKAFELPKGASQKYSLKSPWKGDAETAAIVLAAGEKYTFELEPFEVLIFDATPF